MLFKCGACRGILVVFASFNDLNNIGAESFANPVVVAYETIAL